MNFLRDARFGRRVAIAAAAGLLSLATWPVAAQRAAIAADAADAETTTHVLNRIGFGPRPGDVARVQQVGLQAYIEEQLHPERIDDAALDARLAPMASLSMSSRDLAAQYFMPADMLNRQLQQAQTVPANQMTPPGQPPRPQATPEQRQIRMAAQSVTAELMQAKVLRAVMSERQLEEVLVDFWFNHFNVFIGKGQVRQHLTEYERDAIRPHVLGRFRDMLGATAHSPAMLFYLDNFQSQAPPDARTLAPAGRRGRGGVPVRPGQVRPGQPQPQRPARGLNENYARELMELHTLGVDGGYTQQDVVEVARILTGWTIDQPRAGGSFVFRPQVHDAGAKTVLGRKFEAGRGEEEGERLLDMLATHPSTARHISFKLAQRFVADEPPAGLVDRAAKVFLDTDGDLRAVTRAIITSPEFLSPDIHHAKVKTPFEFVASAMRATGAVVNNAQPLVAALANLGMPLYGAQPPTGYSMTADAWVNTGALLARINLAVQVIAGTAPLQPRQDIRGGQRPPPGAQRLRGRGGAIGRNAVRIDLPALAPDTSEATRERLVEAMLGGNTSAATRDTLARAGSPQELLALALGSPEFQRR
jgi:uncharacterized protein (DUF1800 family)